MDKFLQVIYSEYAPSSKNYMWVNSNDGLIYVFHEGKWKELSGGGSIDVKDVVASGTAEDRNRLPNPNDGMLFMQRDNTGYNKLFIYKNNIWSEFVPDVDSQDLFHICSASEYNPETLVPTVVSPKDNTFYLVPSGDDSDIYKEWIYVDSAWELFGSAKVSPQSQVIVATCSTIPDLGNPSVWFFYKPEDVSFSNTGVQTLRNPMNATEFISWMNSNRVKFTQAPPRLRLLCYETIQTWEGGGAYYTLTHFYNNNDFGFSIVNCKDKNYCVLYGFGYDSVNGWYSKQSQYPVELWSAASVDDQTVFSCDALDLYNLTPKQLGQYLYDNYTDYTTTKTFALNYSGYILTGWISQDTDTQKLQWEAEIIHDQVTVTPGSGTAEVGEEQRMTFNLLYDANDDTKCIFVAVPIASTDKGEVTYYYYGSMEDFQVGTYIKLARNGQQTTLTYQQFLDDLYNNRAEINRRNAQLILTTNTTPTLSQGISIYDMILFQAITDSDNHEFVQVEFNIVSDNVMTMNENDRKIIYNSLFFKKQWDTANNQYAYIAKRALRELGEFVEVQSSLPSSLTSKDLGHYSIVDDTIYKVVQDGSNYVWEKQIPPTDTIDKGEMIYYVTKDIIDETSSNYENPASTTYYKPQLYDAEPLSFDLTEFLRDVFRNGRQGMELNARRGAKLIVEFLPRKNSNYSENQKIFHLAYVRQIPTSSISTSVNWIISFQGLNYTIDTESVSEKINYEIVNIEYKFRTPPTGALIYPSVTVTRTRIPSTNYIETQTSLPTGLTAEDLNRHCIVDNQLYKVVQDGSDYVWQKIKNLYSNVILFGYGSWIMTDEHGVEINNFQWRKPDGSAITWNEVSTYIFNEIEARQTHTTAMSGISSQGWQVQESIYICMQDTARPTYNLMFELQSVFLDGNKGWSATCLERTIEEKSSGGFERSITQTYHMFYLPPTYAPNGRLTKDVIYGDVMVANDLPAARDIHLGKCAIVGNKLYKCSYVSGSYQWDEVPIGKDNAIIDVTTLPTTDIQTESLYRVAGQVSHRNTTADEFTPLTDFVGWYKFTDDAINNNDATVMHRTDGTNQISWYPTPGESTTKLVITSGAAEERYNPTPYVSAGILELTDKEHAICGFFRPDPNQPTYYQFNTLTDRNDNELFDQKPSKLYHYKDNAWIELQPTTDTNLTTTDKTIVGAINEISSNIHIPVIDVNSLPSTNIDTKALYRVVGQVFYEGTDVTEFGLYKFTEHGIELGCVADANSITVLDGVNKPINYTWELFNSIDIYNNIEHSHSIEKTLVPTEADFALIDTLPQSPGTSKTNIARHISVCEIIPSKLYHYKDNAWIQIQPTTDNTLTTTDKTIVGAINEISSNIHIPVIDVNSLPSTNIDTKALYRVVGQVLYEGTDVTSYPSFKITHAGADAGCTANGLLIQIPNGTTTTTRTWQQFSAEELTSLIYYNYVEIASTRSESDFGLITTDESVMQGMARHNDSFTFIYELYHYVNNAWQQLQHTSAQALTTTSKEIVGAINELNSNKAPMDNVKVTGNITWGADLFWDIDTVITSEMKIKLATVNIPFLGTGNCNGTMIIIERRASATVESQLFIEFYANQSSNNSQVQSPYNKFFLAGTLDASYNGQFKTYFDNIAWSDWQRIEIGSHNTLASSTIQSVDECIFPFIYHRGNRTFKDSRVYLASMTDPISGTTINGECHTVEVTRSEKLIVEQTFTRFNSSENTRIVYFRRGVHTFDTQTGDWGDNADVIANIGWQDWYPIEYPDTDLVLKTGWTGNIHFSVTGGILLINVLNLVKTASATSALPLDATANSGLITLPFKYVVWGTIFNSNSVALLKVKWQQQTESQEGGFVTSTLMVANEPYLGTLQIHLGY